MPVGAVMETRLTLRPGQHGTRKLVERFGERLIRVRYLYDVAAGRRLKTVELIVEAVPWIPRPRRPRRRDDEIVAVRIGFEETDLRERARRLGAVWRPQQNCGNCAGATFAASASPLESSTPELLISSSHLPPYIPAHMYAGRCISPRTDGCIYIWMLLACPACRSINSWVS